MLTLDFINSQLDNPIFTKHCTEVRINCPECGDDKYHCYCNLIKRVYYCHKCGAKGKIVDRSETSAEQFTTLPKNFSVPITTENRQVRNLPHCGTLFSVPNAALAYLSKRGVT